jgi:peptidoglycan hydrolase CwlO-like protein
MTTEEKIERLTNVVDALASTVTSHDNQIEKLIIIAEKQSEEMQELRERMNQLVRGWQAYLNTIRPQ